MKKLFYGIMALWVLAGCSDEPSPKGQEVEPTGEPVEITLTAAESRAAEATADFAYDFFAQMSLSEAADKNMVCSPASAGILLSMLANGTAGDCRGEIIEVLGCEDIDALNSLANKQLTLLPKVDPTVTMTFANAMWYRDRYRLRSSFESVMDDSYAMKAYAHKFDDGIVAEINGWVKENTKGIIDRILDKKPDDDCVAIQANALYFKGAWANPFEESETAAGNFQGIEKASRVPMMHKRGMQHYAVGADFQAVKMELGTKGYEAVFVLPSEETSIADFVDADGLRRAADARYIDDSIDFILPRFKFNSDEMRLNEVLKALGIKNIETYGDFTAFEESVSGFFKVSQKTGVEFNEAGAEGAAVTWALWDAASSGESAAPAKVHFTRPFLFMIHEKSTGAILFAGRIVSL